MKDTFLRGEDYGAIWKTEHTSRQMPSKISDSFKVIYVLQGQLDYWVEDNFYKVSPRDILILPSEVMAGGSIKVKNETVMYFEFWVNAEMLDFLARGDQDTNYLFRYAKEENKFLVSLDVDSSNYLRSILEKMVEECVSPRFNAGLMSKAMLCLALNIINRTVNENNSILFKSGEKARLSKVIKYIKENCAEQLTVEGLAEKFGYSESNLAHSFKKQTGTSLYHYILLYRLQVGRKAMLEGTPIKKAYEHCGFGDYAGFYRAFTKEFGISPQKYKKKYQTS